MEIRGGGAGMNEGMIPQEVLAACVALEGITGEETLGIHFDAALPAWVISSFHEEIAHLNPARFGGATGEEQE